MAAICSRARTSSTCATRLFLYKAARPIGQGGKADLEAAMAKLSISELFVENSLDAMRIHGGRGYMSEYGVERDPRDALGASCTRARPTSSGT